MDRHQINKILTGHGQTDNVGHMDTNRHMDSDKQSNTNKHTDNIEQTNRPVCHWFLSNEAHNSGPHGDPMASQESNSTYQNNMTMDNNSDAKPYFGFTGFLQV